MARPFRLDETAKNEINLHSVKAKRKLLKRKKYEKMCFVGIHEPWSSAQGLGLQHSELEKKASQAEAMIVVVIVAVKT